MTFPISEPLHQNKLHMKSFGMLAKALMLSLSLCFAAVACDKYDDSEIWDAVNDLKDKVEALENLITVVKDSDGIYYWAVYRDGKAEMLIVDGKQVPVAVKPALKLSEDNEWLISVDGGGTWISTGVFADEDSDVEMFFADVKVEGDTLVLTLSDGTVVKVPVAGGDAEFSSDVDSLWFSRVSVTKSAAIEMKNVKSYTITEKPEGWKAYIEESYLYVTSPDDFSAASAKGDVKVLALYEGGVQPDILSVYVAHEPAFSLSLDNDAIVVKMSERTGDDFTGYILKAWPEAEYTLDGALQWLNSEGSQTVPYNGEASYSISDLVGDYSPKENYVVMCVPYLPATQVAQGDMKYVRDDVQTVTVAGGNQWAFSDISYDYAHLKAVITDMTKFYGGFDRKEDWESFGMQNVLESFQFRGGPQPCTDLVYDGPASGFPFNETAPELLPSTEYVVWVLPYVVNGKYTAKDFIVRTFTTPGISKDASIPAPSVTVDEVTISGFTATVTPLADAYKTYSAIRPVSVVPEDEYESVVDLLRFCDYSKGGEANVVSTGDYDSNTELCLLSVSFTEDGRYGEVSKRTVRPEELVFSDKLSVSVTGIEHGIGDATFSLEFQGEPASVTYFAQTYVFHSDENIQRFMALGQLDGLRTVSVSSLKDGKLKVGGLVVGQVYTLYLVVSDAEGVYSNLCKYEFTPKMSVDYVLSDSADYEYGMPSLSGTWPDNSTYVMNVDKPAECAKYWIFRADPEYFSNDPWGDSDKIITNYFGEVKEYTESVRGLKYSSMYKASRIYMVWLDDKGQYHAIYEFNPYN